MTEASVAAAIDAIRSLLPGTRTGTLCFQEVLALFECHRMHLRDGNTTGTEKLEILSRPAHGITQSYDTVVNAGAKARLEFDEMLDNEKKEHRHEMAVLAQKRYLTSRTEQSSVRREKDVEMSTKILVKDQTAPRTETNFSGVDWRATVEEFKRLDILAEGKLTFLTLKSALEVRDQHVEDGEIRRWLKENDSGDKGYVNLDDFLRATVFFGPGQGPLSGPWSGDGRSRRIESAFDESSTSYGARIQSQRQREKERIELLKRAFSRYDVDGDGFISVNDLRKAFTASGQERSEDELSYWVRKRDSIGAGAVNFDDFSKFYV